MIPAAARPSSLVCRCRSSDSAIASARPALPAARSARTSTSTAESSAPPRSSTSISGSLEPAGRAPPAGPTAWGAVLRVAGLLRRSTRRASRAPCLRTVLTAPSATDDVEPRPVLDPEALAVAEVIVDRPAASGPGVVVVEHDPSPADQERRDALQARHRGLVPVAVEMGEGDRLVEPDRVLEQPAHQLDVVLADGHAVACEGILHLLVEVVPVPVVGLAPGTLGRAGGDLRVAAMDVRAVAPRRRRDHPEDVVDLHRSLGRLGRGEDDGRAPTRGPRLDDQARKTLALDHGSTGREILEHPGLQVGQVLAAHGRNGLEDALRERPGG